MSHGSTEKCEPNFTPLLDLVLQLVMFFMLCANFVLEQTNVEIKLPEANAAKALEKTEDDPFFLNVNSKGQVLLTPNQREGDIDTLDNEVQVYNYMARQAERSKKAAEARGEKWEKPKTVLILRVDRATPFDKTYPIMKACRRAGYDRVQLRVLLGSQS
jgi:biopolymer transport protein ExbD